MDRTRILRALGQAVPTGGLAGATVALLTGFAQGVILARAGQGWGAAEVGPALVVESLLAGLVVGSTAWLFAGLSRRRWIGWLAGSGLFVGLLLVGDFDAPARGPAPAAVSVTGPRTVVLVTLDTLRRDHVSAYPDAKLPGLTPVLEELASEAIRFDLARAPAPLTLPVHTSMLTGKLPVEHGILRNGMVLPVSDDTALPGLLAGAGYRTAAFTSSSVLHGAHGLARWFSVYRDRLGAHPARDALPLSRFVLGAESVGRLQKEPGDRTVTRALSWLDRVGDDPVFLWVHLYDAHAPHLDRPLRGGRAGAFERLPHPCDYVGHPAQRARSAARFGKKPILVDEAECRERAWTGLKNRLGDYAAEVAFADAQLGRLLAGLRARGRFDDAAIVVAADHGESLTEHQQMISHQFDLYEPVLRVPLLVRPPGGRAEWPAVVDRPVGTVQVAATLARLAGLPPGSIGGRDLLAVAEGQAAGPEIEVAVAPSPLPGLSPHHVALRRGDRKVLSLGGNRYERYALDDDPWERVPLRADDDAPAPEPPKLPQLERTGPPGILGLPGLPDPIELVQRSHAASWPRPEDEHAWRSLPDELAPDFAELEARGDTALAAAEGRTLPDGEVDASLPDDVREALEALGYLQ